MLMVFFIISKYKKKATVDGFINSVFLYCKTGLALLYYYLGMQYFGWYCILCLGIIILRPVTTVPESNTLSSAVFNPPTTKVHGS